MNKTACFLAFVMGAVAGGATAWYYAKKKYEEIAQEEIDSVKKVFSKREKKEESKMVAEENTNQNSKKKPDISKYAGVINKEGYDKSSNGDEEKEQDTDKPYVIAPEFFDENEDYDCASLIYYADGVLTDDNDEPVEDVEGTIGVESLNHFGEYEDDSVFVRNDRLKCDFEILLDKGKYSEIMERRMAR